MKILNISTAILLIFFSTVMADVNPNISIIDSNTNTKALINKPGTYLGETFTFEENHQGNVKVKIGVWEAGIGRLTLKDFPFTEYVLMISGSVIVTELNGNSNTFEAGNTFVIPKGWSGTWDVTKRMKKQIVRIGTK